MKLSEELNIQMKKTKSNYEAQLEKCRVEFANWNHQKIAKKFGLIVDERYLYIRFVGKTYRIDRKTGLAQKSADGESYAEDAGYNEMMSFLDLFSYSKDDLSLSGQWTLIKHVSKMAHSGEEVGSRLFAPYADMISGNIPLFCGACACLRARKVDEGDACYIVDTFDFLPVKLQFWEKDDEFPAQLNLYWDELVLDYVRYETTYYIAAHVLETIKKLMFR